MPEKIVVISQQVRVQVNDPDVIDRVTGPKGDEWRAQLYDLNTEEDVLQHLAYNCLANGAENAMLLDGWADLPEDAVVMSIEPHSAELEAIFDA